MPDPGANASHLIGEEECLVVHADGLGPCRKCDSCGQFIRPPSWGDECPGPTPGVDPPETCGGP